MTWLQFTGTLALTAAMVLATLLAGQDRQHRPVAALLAGWLMSNLAVIALQILVIGPAVITAGGDPSGGIAPSSPLAGWDRAAAHAAHAIELGSSAWLAMCAIWVFGQSRWRFATMPWPALLWVGAVTFFIVSYPDTRALHRLGYLLADMLAVATGFTAFLGWLRRRDRDEGMPPAKKCILLVLVMVGLAVVGAHTVPGYFAGTDRAQASYVIMYAMLILHHGGSLWMSKMSSG